MFAVVLISLWPSHSWICFMGTSLASSSEAQLCRRSWKRICRRPFNSSSLLKLLLRFREYDGYVFVDVMGNIFNPRNLSSNFSKLLEKGQASIVLAGVDDPNGPYDQKRPAQLVREIRQSRGRDAYILMLSHRNDELDLWANMGVQTVLCGHGHGGIVRLPFVGAVFGTHLDLFPDYTAGLYRKGQTSMIVSRGLGGSRKLPLRIGNRPEIVTVILKTDSGEI